MPYPIVIVDSFDSEVAFSWQQKLPQEFLSLTDAEIMAAQKVAVRNNLQIAASFLVKSTLAELQFTVSDDQENNGQTLYIREV